MTAPGYLLAWTLPALVFLTLSSAVYYLAVCAAALRFRAHRTDGGEPPRSGSELPAISILKPVDGCDPDFDQNIRSHALQDYSRFELLFGVADREDPALVAIERLAGQFPNLRIEAFVCDTSGPGNRKVQKLERLEQEARFDFLLVNDSDICVDQNYLRDVMQPFHADQGQKVGLVSCPYRARPGGTFPSLLEALSISAEFQSQVLLARLLGQVNFALGATMLFRRRELQRIGGFRSLTPYLADDFRLGNSIAALGLEILIAPHPVEIALAADPWRDVWKHQLRWSRTIRISRPLGHFGLLFTQGTVWSLLCLATAGSAPLAIVPGVTLLLRLAAAWLAGWVCMRSPAVRRRLPLVFLADVLSFAVWAASFFSRRVDWRNRQLTISRDGRIIHEPVSAEQQRPVRAAR